jgi:YD repeat-containing protein
VVAGPAPANTIQYSYDRASNLLSVQDAFSSSTMTYDARNRLDTVATAGTPGGPAVVLDYAYDSFGNVTGVAETIDGTAGATTSTVYDALYRPVRQSGGGLSAKRTRLQPTRPV